jgi:ABC-type sugar transport system substrate-binding protein
MELRARGVKSALAKTKWIELAPPISCNESSTLAIQQLYDLLHSDSNLQGIVSLGGWPMYEPEAFRLLSEKYKSQNKTLVVGEMTSAQQVLFFENYVDELIGPSLDDIGGLIVQALVNETNGIRSRIDYVDINVEMDSPPEFVLVSKDVNSPFSFDIVVGIAQEASSDNIMISLHGPDKDDAVEQAKLIRDIVDYPIKFGILNLYGIAISVLDEKITGSAIDYVRSKNIPVVTFDSDAPESLRNDFVGANNFDVGKKLGSALNLLYPEGGNFRIITGISPNLKYRVEGVERALIGSKWSVIQPALNCNENSTLALQLMISLADNPGVQGIISVGGWPMFEPDAFRNFSRDYKNRTKYVIGDATSVQQVLFHERVYTHGLIGPSPYEMGMYTYLALQRASQGKPPLNYTVPVEGLTCLTISHLSVLGYTLFCVVALCSIVLLIWTYIHRKSRTIRASQPIFMAMLCLGSIIMGSAMIPLGIERSDIACMSIPWLFIVGFCTIFSALFSKTWRLVKIMKSAARFRRIKLKITELLYPYFAILAGNVIILICWTVINPLVYVVDQSIGHDMTTYGHCISKNQNLAGKAAPFLGCLAGINGSLLVLANWMAFKSRKIQVEFRESSYIALIMFCMLQAGLIGIPILLLVLDQPQPYYIILVILDFSICMSTLVFMFTPKVISVRKATSKPNERQTQATYGQNGATHTSDNSNGENGLKLGP